VPAPELTEAQVVTRLGIIIDQFGRCPDDDWKDGILDVYFMTYGSLTIGIERDGYAHS
jgi:hypothetical protein